MSWTIKDLSVEILDEPVDGFHDPRRERLRALFGSRTPIRDIERVADGSPQAYLIEWTFKRGEPPPKTVTAAIALVRQHMSLRHAHAAMNTLVELGRIVVVVPRVENAQVLEGELPACHLRIRQCDA